MNYLVCPCCGYKLLKAGEGSNIEMSCPKCNKKLVIEITNDKLIINKMLASEVSK